MISVQDKHNYNGEVVYNYLKSRYTDWFASQPGWWLEPMPALTLGNVPARLEFSRRMSGIHGDGDPVWSAALMHMAWQVSGSPFSIEGPEGAVEKALSFVMSVPQGDTVVQGDYRNRMKEIVTSYITADVGAMIGIAYEKPKPIRPGVFTKPKPVAWDTFDPGRIRLVAPPSFEYPYAYKTLQIVDTASRTNAMSRLFYGDEVPVHRDSAFRLLNMPQSNEELFGCGVSPSAYVYPQWSIAMGYLALLLQDSTNTAAYQVLVARGLNRDQVSTAMEDREKNLRSGKDNPLASALMLFGPEDLLGDGSNGPMIQGVPMKRYPENFHWREWLEERIQVYSTILGISPQSIIMSIYARANQAGAQYAADESGVRQASMMADLGDIFRKVITQFGADFQFRSHRLADREREFAVQKVAFEAWAALYQSNINGVPLMGNTAEEAAARVRTMMAEQRLIKPEYAEGEDAVVWDQNSNTVGGVDAQVKALTYLQAAARGEDYVSVEVNPGEDQTRVKKERIGRCVIREPGRPVMWRGWSAADERKWAPLRRKLAVLRESARTYREAQAVLKAGEQERNGAMVAFYVPAEVAESLALRPGPAASYDALSPKDLHVTLAYLGDVDTIEASEEDAVKVLRVFARNHAPVDALVSGLGRFNASHRSGMQAVYASVDAPELIEWREDLLEALDAIGIEQQTEHGFTPHITLAYVPAGDPTPDAMPIEIPVRFPTVSLSWGIDVVHFPLGGPSTKEGEGRAPRSAPRKMRAVQDAWDGELDDLLSQLTNALGRLDRTPTDRERKQLQGLLNRWSDAIYLMEGSIPEDADIDFEKLERAKVLIEDAQGLLDRNDDGAKILALLAILAFADGVQRRGQDAMMRAVAVGGASAEVARGLMVRAMRRHGAYVNGSLAPDLVDDWLADGALSGRLNRRAKVFYGGAVWALMQASMLAGAAPGQRVTVAGPLDENTCLISDPGAGLACEEIVGQTYRVGMEQVPRLGVDTKCGQACRHWYEIS